MVDRRRHSSAKQTNDPGNYKVKASTYKLSIYLEPKKFETLKTKLIRFPHPNKNSKSHQKDGQQASDQPDGQTLILTSSAVLFGEQLFSLSYLILEWAEAFV